MARQAKVQPAKSVSKKTARKAKSNNIYWVLSERTKLFSWKAIEVYKTQDAAVAARIRREEASPYSLNGYKVDRVVLM